MKKILLSFLIFTLTFTTGLTSVFAVQSSTTFDSICTEYLNYGSYFITIIETVSDSSSLASTTNTRESSTVTKSKTSIYYGNNGDKLWSIKVTGSFTYGNGSAKCNSVTPTGTSFVDDWKVSNISGSKSGASATASATGKQYYNNTVINTVNKSVTLTCSPAGIFS